MACTRTCERQNGQAKSNPAGEGSLGLFCDDGGIRAAHSTAQVDRYLALSCLVLSCLVLKREATGPSAQRQGRVEGIFRETEPQE